MLLRSKGALLVCVYTPAPRRVKDGWTDNFCLMGEIRATKSTLRGPGVELEKSLSDRILLSWREAARRYPARKHGAAKGATAGAFFCYYKSIKQMEGNNLRRPAIALSCPQLGPNEASKAWTREELQPCRRMAAIKEKGISLASLPFAPPLLFLPLLFSPPSLFISLFSLPLSFFYSPSLVRIAKPNRELLTWFLITAINNKISIGTITIIFRWQ